MGIKEFNFLKKTLSEIESNKDILHSQRSEKRRMEKRISTLKNEITSKKMLISQQDYAEELNREFESSMKNLDLNKQKINDLKIELEQIEEDKREEEFTIFGYLSFVIVVSYAFLIFGAQIFLGNGWMTLLFDSEGDLEFECENGNILPVYYVNDGMDDCGDNSDENVQVTPELSDRIARSETDSNWAMFTGCCLTPIILSALLTWVASLNGQGNSIDEIKTKKRVLKTRITKLRKKIGRPLEIRSQMRNIEKKVEENKTTLSIYETKLKKVIKDNESIGIEIDNTERNISKLYESIKHLIPYSYQLKEE